jgi:hypothetical protein
VFVTETGKEAAVNFSVAPDIPTALPAVTALVEEAVATLLLLPVACVLPVTPILQPVVLRPLVPLASMAIVTPTWGNAFVIFPLSDLPATTVAAKEQHQGSPWTTSIATRAVPPIPPVFGTSMEVFRLAFARLAGKVLAATLSKRLASGKTVAVARMASATLPLSQIFVNVALVGLDLFVRLTTLAALPMRGH